ncbi:MAG: hypothetical protein U1E83_04760 [Methylotetracoccus sp.]
MATPQEDLKRGVEHLGPLMEAHGFAFSLTAIGNGSGGPFAAGEFTRGDRVLGVSVRTGLGLVEYRLGRLCISHEDYLRYTGAWGSQDYPNFGGTVQDSFVALEHDLRRFFAAFLSDDDAEFLRVIAARDAEPNKFKGLAGLGDRKR